MKNLLSKSVATGLIAGLAAAAMPVLADENVDSRWYFTPKAGYILSDDDLEEIGGRDALENGPIVEFNYGRQINSWLNFEYIAFADRQESDKNFDNDLDQFGGGADILIMPWRGGFQPYLLLGAGAIWSQADGIDDDGKPNPYANAGLGFMLPFNENGLALRAEAKHRWEQNDEIPASGKEEFQNIIGTIGLQIPLGSRNVAVEQAPVPVAPAPAPAPVPVAPVVLDSDNDGVPNEKDRCPNSKANVTVDSNGCEVDSDDDGVADSADKCADTPKEASVGRDGCPLDGDNDGVADYQDACPNTKADTKVDTKGCKLKPIIKLDGVKFELNSARLVTNATEKLDDAAITLKRYPDTRVEVAGHTDSTGDARYNQSLSLKRANSVRNYLINAGVGADQMTTKGFGESDPVADNKTSEGRKQNRRVELRVQK